MQETSRTSNPVREDPAMLPRETVVKEKQPFTEPKLTFVEPKLVKHGRLEEMTGFFGPFSP